MAYFQRRFSQKLEINFRIQFLLFLNIGQKSFDRFDFLEAELISVDLLFYYKGTLHQELGELVINNFTA